MADTQWLTQAQYDLLASELKERVELRRYHGTALLQGFDALQTLKKRIFGKRLPIQ